MSVSTMYGAQIAWCAKLFATLRYFLTQSCETSMTVPNINAFFGLAGCGLEFRTFNLLASDMFGAPMQAGRARVLLIRNLEAPVSMITG